MYIYIYNLSMFLFLEYILLICLKKLNNIFCICIKNNISD